MILSSEELITNESSQMKHDAYRKAMISLINRRGRVVVGGVWGIDRGSGCSNRKWPWASLHEQVISPVYTQAG